MFRKKVEIQFLKLILMRYHIIFNNILSLLLIYTISYTFNNYADKISAKAH